MKFSAIHDGGCWLQSFRSFCCKHDGGALVELAFVMPVALLFTLGVLQFLLLLCSDLGATYGTRSAVRYATVHGSASNSPCTASSVDSYIRPYLVGVPASAITITTIWTPNNNPGNTVTIKTAISFPAAIPFSSALTLKGSVTASGIILQ